MSGLLLFVMMVLLLLAFLIGFGLGWVMAKDKYRPKMSKGKPESN